MKLLLELSMECESLAQAEAFAAARSMGRHAEVELTEPGVMILETDSNPVELSRRLGLCHFVSEWLGSSDHSELSSLAEDVNVPGPIRVRSTKVGEIDVDLARASRAVGGIVARSDGVNLRAPKTDLRVVFSSKAHIGRLLGAVDRSSFERRKNRHMPFVFPASLHPKFARALVNLTEIRSGGRLLDPFSGTGAILAEAAWCGLNPIGSDIAQKMIDGSRRNLAHLGLSASLVRCDVADVSDMIGTVDGIATDPPYGRSTSTEGEKIHDLLDRAFRAFSKVLGRGSKIAVVLPDVQLIQGVSDFELEQQHDLWVHRSLTRTFCVLRRL